MHPKRTIPYYIKTNFSFFLWVARDSNVNFLCFNVVSETTICIFQFIIIFIQHNYYYMLLLYFTFILNMFFYFSYLTCYIVIFLGEQRYSKHNCRSRRGRSGLSSEIIQTLIITSRLQHQYQLVELVQ